MPKKSAKPAKANKKNKKVETTPVAAPRPTEQPMSAAKLITLVAGNRFTADDMPHLGDAIQIVALLVSEALLFPNEWQEHDGDIGQTFFRAVHVVARSMSGVESGWNPVELTQGRT